MKRQRSVQNRVIHRFKIAHGHLRKVVEMAENEEYCIDILHHSQAVQKALREVDNLLLEHHLSRCVPEALEAGNKRAAITEVMNVFKKMST